MTTRLHLLHTCNLPDGPTDHRAAIDYSIHPIGGGQVRLYGTRCDGSILEAIGRTLPGGGLVVNPSTHDDERHMLDHGVEYVSSQLVGWTPLIDFGEQPADDPAQPDLFGGES